MFALLLIGSELKSATGEEDMTYTPVLEELGGVTRLSNPFEPKNATEEEDWTSTPALEERDEVARSPNFSKSGNATGDGE